MENKYTTDSARSGASVFLFPPPNSPVSGAARRTVFCVNRGRGFFIFLLLFPALSHAGLYIEGQFGVMKGMVDQTSPYIGIEAPSPIRRQFIYGGRVGYESKKRQIDISIGQTFYETKECFGKEDSPVIRGPLKMDLYSIEAYIGYPLMKRLYIRGGGGIGYVAIEHEIARDIRDYILRFAPDAYDQTLEGGQYLVAGGGLEYVLNKYVSFLAHAKYFNFQTRAKWVYKYAPDVFVDLSSMIYDMSLRFYFF